MIDCGTTKRYLTQRFEEIDISFDTIDGLLITHDHIDHTSQVKLFAHTKIYAPEPLKYDHTLVQPYQRFQIGDAVITPIPTSHDADVSVGYVIEDGNEKLVYITDTGYVREKDKALISDADYYIFESNHDPQLLMRTKRPYMVKQRILSDTGHLSNQDAASILSEIVSDRTKEIVLAHLSLEANTTELAIDTTLSKIEGRTIRVKAAKQFEIVKSGL